MCALILMLAACNEAKREETVPGPETDTLLPGITGHVVFTDSAKIVAIELPSLKRTTVWDKAQPGTENFPHIHALSGPDSEGRVAYIENYGFVRNTKKRHLLKTIKLDGTEDTTLFTRPGDALWASSFNGEIGSKIALAPVGGHVALLSGTKHVKNPKVFLLVGDLEIWDANTKSGVTTKVKAVDHGYSWLPDGKRIAYVKLVDPKSESQDANTLSSAAQDFPGWPQIPCVFIYNIETAAETFVHVGQYPVVAQDGSAILVANDASQWKDIEWKRIELSTGKAERVTWPGRWSFPVTLFSNDIVLAWCLPTSCTATKQTESYGPIPSICWWALRTSRL